MANPKVQFIMTGFSEVLGCRVFAFEGISADQSRTPLSVTADLALARRYAIRLQELPLLCRGFLERCYAGEEKRAFTYSEGEMRHYSEACTATRDAAAQRKKPPRRPTAEPGTVAKRLSPW